MQISKKRCFFVAILLAMALLLAFTLAACGKNNDLQNDNTNGQNPADYAKYAGTYYEVNGADIYADSYIKLFEDGSWINSASDGGTYSVSGQTVTLYEGSARWASGTVNSGRFTVEIDGATVVYTKGTPNGNKPTGGDDPSGGEEQGGPEEVEKYKITFVLNGGEGSYAAEYHEAGSLLSNLPQPTRKGYIFTYWLGDDRKTYTRASVMPAYNLALTAQWEKEVSYYKDEYVTFKPATQGRKQSDEFYSAYSGMGITTYVYVELSSDDLGGRNHVGMSNNFDLSQKVNMEYSATAGYSLNWYDGDFNTPNGAQLFTLYYGSNIQLLTVTRGSQVVRRYLIDIYILHDYQVKLYTNVFERSASKAQPYETYWVRENEKVPADMRQYRDFQDFVPDKFVYYNNDTSAFEPFDFATVVRGDWDLYETYKDVTIGTNLGGGTMSGTIKLTPYERYQQLPIPTRDGYDFFGWRAPDGTYFADITGFSATNYLYATNSRPFFTSLTAVWAEKRYYEQWEGDKVTFVPTVPVITYTSAAHSEILETIYVPNGYDCTLPVKTPSDGYFVKWQEWSTSGNIQQKTVNFNVKIATPKALHGYVDTGWSSYISIPLNDSRRFTSSNSSQMYRVMMPVKGDYILRVSGNVTIAVNSFANNQSATYTVSGSRDITLASNLGDEQYASFYVTKSSGSFSIGLYGATAQTAGKPISGGTFDKVGDTLTAPQGDDWCCWLYGDKNVSDEASRNFTLTSSYIGKTVEKRYGHTLGEWTIDVEYKCEDTVTRHKDCSLCDYSQVEDNYYVAHELGEWIDDNEPSCTARGHHHKECANCEYTLEEDYGEIQPHKLGEWKIDGDYKCGDTVTRHKDCANCEYSQVEDDYYVDHDLGEWIEDSEATCTAKAHHHQECANCDYTQEEDYGDFAAHTWNGDTNKCDVCGMDKPYEEKDGKIYFGEYPQTKETDNGITATLAQMSGDRPVRGNSGKWTDYKYYINGEATEYMWYIDIEYNGARYRGVYFTSYRPSATTTSSSSTDHTHQDDNGYYTNTLYWFKWEPIEWRVLERTDGEAFLMSNVILDSQQYYRTASGYTYENNYKESDIRAWLNDTFFEWAFDELDQSIIKTTLVDNSASTTDSSSNSYACANTNDKVFLLSYKDVWNTSYGFNSSSGRRLKTTGYAQSQGAYTSTDSSYRGNGRWWLRSPNLNYSRYALYVDRSGDAGDSGDVDGTSDGVVPALRITL